MFTGAPRAPMGGGGLCPVSRPGGGDEAAHSTQRIVQKSDARPESVMYL